MHMKRVCLRSSGIAAVLFVTGCYSDAPFTLTPGTPTPVISGVASSAPATTRSSILPKDADSLIEAMFAAVNAERKKVGLPALVRSDKLREIADDYADRLITGEFFSHIDPETSAGPGQRANRQGYVFYKVGENLAAAQTDPAMAMRDLMSSPTHRANILSPDFTEIGIAVRDGGQHGRYWVQEFGRPLGQ